MTAFIKSSRADEAISILVDASERKRPEAALQESEKHLRNIFNQTSAGIAQVDLSGRFVLVNQRFCAITGYSAEELREKTCTDITHPEDKACNDSLFVQALQEHKPYVIEKRYIRPDGSYVWVRNSVSEISDGDGPVQHMLAVCVDITDQKQAEALLHEQNQLLERIAAGHSREECLTALTEAVARLHPSARAGVFLANADRTAMADAYAAHLQPSFAASLYGAPISELLIGACNTAIYQGEPITCPDIARAEQWSEMWRNLCLTHGIRACHSTPVFAPSGQAVASFVLCFAEAGAPNAWELSIAEFGAHVANVVIERERVTEQLRQSRAQLETELASSKLLQSISTELIHEEDTEALYKKLVDAAAALVDSDCASMQMLYPERGKGGELRLLASHGFNVQAAQFWQWVDAASRCICGEALRTGQRVIVPDVEHCDFMAGTADLAECLQAGIQAVQSTPLLSRGGKVVGMISTHWRKRHQPSERDLRLLDVLARQAADLIERRRVQDALRQQTESLKEADRKKDEFLATLAHELRNPLAPIRNGLQMVKLARNDEAVIEQSRAMMERQLEQLVRLVDDLLDVSRINRGTIELQKERIELAAVVRTALETCESIIKQHGHELTVTMPEEPVYLDADKVRLAQVLCNLLNNAAKYSAKGGRIGLTAERASRESEQPEASRERQRPEVILRVKDTGVGIPAPMLAKVFDLFMQVDRSLEKSHGGLGIGLTLVKQLVELHGGSIEAKSEGHGLGSEFIVRLPIVLSRAGWQHDKGDGESPRPTARRRILVVDDNIEVAQSLAMMLEMMGNEVRTAHDGLEGVEEAAAFRPELILLDIGMPKLNGYEACRRIRQEPWGQGIVLAALTGWGQDEDKRRSEEAGFDFHLVKPVKPGVLEKVLAQVQPAAAV